MDKTNGSDYSAAEAQSAACSDLMTTDAFFLSLLSATLCHSLQLSCLSATSCL